MSKITDEERRLLNEHSLFMKNAVNDYLVRNKEKIRECHYLKNTRIPAFGRSAREMEKLEKSRDDYLIDAVSILMVKFGIVVFLCGAGLGYLLARFL